MHQEQPFGIPTKLYRLRSSEHQGEPLRVQVDICDNHPYPVLGIPGFLDTVKGWMEKVRAGTITNGVTLAPVGMSESDGVLHITVVPEDYITTRSASSAWQGLSQEAKDAYLSNPDGYSPRHSRFLGTACAVVGADGMLVMARRSMKTATEPGRWAPAIGEGMDDSDIHEDGTADLRGCILRGAMEELGITLSKGDAERCLLLSSVTVNEELGEVVVNGCLDLRLALDCHLTSSDIIACATQDARDAWERDRYAALPMTHDAISAFAGECDADGNGAGMSGYGLVTAGIALEWQEAMRLHAHP